jgi:hypothetical protein
MKKVSKKSLSAMLAFLTLLFAMPSYAQSVAATEDSKPVVLMVSYIN